MKDKPREDRRRPRRDDAPKPPAHERAPAGARPPREGSSYARPRRDDRAPEGSRPPQRSFDRRDDNRPPRERGDAPPPRRDFDRPPPRRDFDGPPPRRDFDRPPPRRDFDGPPPRRDFDRPPPRRDFDRPPPRRDFDRPPPRRDFDGPPPRRDFDGPPPRRDFDGPPPRRDFDRPPPRDNRDFDRRPPPRREYDRGDAPRAPTHEREPRAYDDRGRESYPAERPARSIYRVDDLRDAPAFAPDSAPRDEASEPAAPREQAPFEREDRELIYGIRAALAVFAKRPEDVQRIWHTEAVRHQIGEVLREAARRRIAYSEGDDAELERVSGAVHHEGLVMRVRPRTDVSLELFAENLVRTRGAAIALDRVNNPHNLGAVLRSAAYFGCAGVLYAPSAQPAGLTPSATRVAEGGAEHVPVVQCDDLADALRRLRARGVRVVGTDAKARKTSFDESWPRPTVVVIGNEREGLRPTVRLECDDTIAIPGTGDIDSLNASVAAGVLLADLARTAKSADAYVREGRAQTPEIRAVDRPTIPEKPAKKRATKRVAEPKPEAESAPTVTDEVLVEAAQPDEPPGEE